jgi:hypothetical protein
MGRIPPHPGVYVRVANKGDKSRQRNGIAVRPERTTARARERIKKSVRLHSGSDRESIAYLNEDVKCFAVKSRK